jgi:uncharacterized protein (DUF488 family)
VNETTEAHRASDPARRDRAPRQGVYTIGHSTHPIDVFIGLLRAHAVEAVVDVRSHPYSRFNPQYRRDALQAALESAGIEYVFLGRELGARSNDSACHIDGRVDYALLAQTAGFRSGLDRVEARAARQRVALMCAEKDPLVCHRTILVCRELILRRAESVAGVPCMVHHILADGRLETQYDADARLLREVGVSTDLFRDLDEAVADAYRQRAKQIAWVAGIKSPRAG